MNLTYIFYAINFDLKRSSWPYSRPDKVTNSCLTKYLVGRLYGLKYCQEMPQ